MFSTILESIRIDTSARSVFNCGASPVTSTDSLVDPVGVKITKEPYLLSQQHLFAGST